MNKSIVFPHIADRLTERTFPNGLRVFVYPDHRAGVFTAQAWVETGSIHEQEFLGCGLSHFLEHMLFNGTEHYPGPSDIADRAEALGAVLNAWTSYANTTYYMDGPSAALTDVLDMLADMISAPLFPDEIFQREKKVILRECAMRDDAPQTVLYEKMEADLFRMSPHLRCPVIGFREGIEKVDRAMMMQYYERRYSPHRCFFVVTGDVEPEKVFDFLEKRLGTWQRRGFADPVLSQEPPVCGIRKSVQYFPDTVARMVSGFLLPSASSPDMPALDVLCGVLAGSESARLNTELRMKQQIVLDVDVFNYVTPHSGMLAVALKTTQENMEKAVDSLRRSLKNVCDHGITQPELDRVIRGIRCSQKELFLKNSKLARAIGASVLTFGTAAPLDTYIDNVQALSVTDIQKAAQKYLTLDNCTQTFLLPESARKKQNVKSAASPAGRPVLHSLTNGQKALLLPDNGNPFISASFCFHGGAAYETTETAGYSALLCHALFCGAGPYSEEELNRELDDRAVFLDIDDGFNSVTVRMESEPADFKEAMRLLTLILGQPSFSDKEFEREKKELIQEWESSMQNPNTAAFEYAKEAYYGQGRTYGLTIFDKIRAVKKATPESLRNFLQNIVLAAPGSVFGMAGACPEKEMLAMIRNFRRAITWNMLDPGKPEGHPSAGKKSRLVRYTDREQAVPVLVFGFPAVNKAASALPARITMMALQGMSSSLFKNIREAEGLAYYVSCARLPGFGSSVLLFYAGTQAETAEKVFEKYETERKRLAEQGLSPDEFESAKVKTQFFLASRMQNPADILFDCCVNEYLGLCWHDLYEALDKLPDLSMEDTNVFVRKFFHSAGRQILIRKKM